VQAIVNRLNDDQRRARHALQRFTYSFYLKDNLKPRFEKTSVERIWIAGEPFTREGLEEHVEGQEKILWSGTIFNWTKTTTIPKPSTIEFIYRWFGKNAGLLPFDEFNDQHDICSESFNNHWPAYIEYLDGLERCAFTLNDLISYGVSINTHVTLDLKYPESDRKKSRKQIALLLGVLLGSEDSVAKEVTLKHIESDLQNSIQSSDIGDELQSIQTQIDTYRQTNPLSAFRRLTVQVASRFSKRVLILFVGSLLCGLAAIALIQPVNTPDENVTHKNALTDPLEDSVKAFHYFGMAEPYDSTSFLIAIPVGFDSADYWYRLGLNEASDSMRIIYFTNAIRYRHDFHEAYYNRGHANDVLHFYDDAIIDYTSSIAIYPEDYRAYNNRGFIQYNRGEHKAAIQDYTSAIQIKPDYILGYDNRAFAYADLSRYAEAISDFKKVIALGDTSHWAYFNLSKARVDSLLVLVKRTPPKTKSDFRRVRQFTSEIMVDASKAIPTHSWYHRDSIIYFALTRHLANIRWLMEDAERSGKEFDSAKLEDCSR
jgi:tetratricopeptide (TPR) repeat protein